MKTVAIIANPKSGNGRAREALQCARRSLWGWPLKIFTPGSLQELHAICRTFEPSTHEALIVIGGDGTLNQVVRATRTLPNAIPLCPFPAGTANDLAAKLGIRPDWGQIQDLLDHRRIEWIDCLSVNSVPFTTVAGMGAGAQLTAEYNTRRESSPLFRLATQYLKSHAYTALSAKTLLFNRNYTHRLHFKADGFDDKLQTPVVFICNQSRLASRMTVAPESPNGDGRFHVMIVPRTRRHQILLGLASLQSGVIPKDMIVFSTTRLSVRDLDGRALQVFGDGETLIESPELHFAVEPNKLLVYSQNGRTNRKNSLARSGLRIEIASSKKEQLIEDEKVTL